MNEFLMAMSVFLLANLLVGLARVHRGPTPSDRLLALLLFGTTTVAIVLLTAYARQAPALLTVALLFVALAAIATIAFTQLPRPGHDGARDPWA